MKAEIELTLDRHGRPAIKFRHHERDSSLEQEVLALFVKGANENGIELLNINGKISDLECYENYIVAIKRKATTPKP